MSHPPVVLGLDFGGTKIAAAVCDLAGNKLASTVVSSCGDRGARVSFDHGIETARELLRTTAPDISLAAVGAATFGIPFDDRVELAPAIKGWGSLQFGRELRAAFPGACAGATAIGGPGALTGWCCVPPDRLALHAGHHGLACWAAAGGAVPAAEDEAAGIGAQVAGQHQAQAEGPGGDDVALDLVRPAVDRLGPAEQEQPLPVVHVVPGYGGRGAEDLHGQFAEGLVPAGPQDLQDRGLGAVLGPAQGVQGVGADRLQADPGPGQLVAQQRIGAGAGAPGHLDQVRQFAAEGSGSEIRESETVTAPGEDGAGSPQPASPVMPKRFVAYVFDDVHIAFGDLARLREAADRALPQIKGVPVVALSARTGEGLEALMAAVMASLAA